MTILFNHYIFKYQLSIGSRPFESKKSLVAEHKTVRNGGNNSVIWENGSIASLKRFPLG